MKKIQNLLYICLFLALSFSLGAQNLDPRDTSDVVHGLRELTTNEALVQTNNTGVESDALIALKQAANELRASAPSNIASNFKVYDYATYPALSQMGKDADSEAMMKAMEAKIVAANISSAPFYYCLIGKYVSSTTGKTSFTIKLKLPVAGTNPQPGLWNNLTPQKIEGIEKDALKAADPNVLIIGIDETTTKVINDLKQRFKNIARGWTAEFTLFTNPDNLRTGEKYGLTPDGRIIESSPVVAGMEVYGVIARSTDELAYAIIGFDVFKPNDLKTPVKRYLWNNDKYVNKEDASGTDILPVSFSSNDGQKVWIFVTDNSCELKYTAIQWSAAHHAACATGSYKYINSNFTITDWKTTKLFNGNCADAMKKSTGEKVAEVVSSGLSDLDYNIFRAALEDYIVKNTPTENTLFTDNKGAKVMVSTQQKYMIVYAKDFNNVYFDDAIKSSPHQAIINKFNNFTIGSGELLILLVYDGDASVIGTNKLKIGGVRMTENRVMYALNGKEETQRVDCEDLYKLPFKAILEISDLLSRGLENLKFSDKWWKDCKEGAEWYMKVLEYAGIGIVLKPIMDMPEFKTITTIGVNDKVSFFKIQVAYMCGAWNGVVDIAKSVPELIKLLNGLATGETTEKIGKGYTSLQQSIIYEADGVTPSSCGEGKILCKIWPTITHGINAMLAQLVTPCDKANFAGQIIGPLATLLLPIPKVPPGGAQSLKAIETVINVLKWCDDAGDIFNYLGKSVKFIKQASGKLNIEIKFGSKYQLDVKDGKHYIMEDGVPVKNPDGTPKAFDSADDAFKHVTNALDVLFSTIDAFKDMAAPYKAKFKDIYDKLTPNLQTDLVNACKNVNKGYLDDLLELSNKNGKSLKECIDEFGCFVAGTPVRTKLGLVPIETLHEGDSLSAYNDNTRQVEQQRITARSVHTVRELQRLTLSNDEVILTTPNHKFFTHGTYIEAEYLHVGDTLFSINSSSPIWLKNTQHLDSIAEVYNFTVESCHNYFVGSTAVLVHNEHLGLLGKIGKSYADVANKLKSLSPDLAAKVETYIQEFGGTKLEAYLTQLNVNPAKLDELVDRLKRTAQSVKKIELISSPSTGSPELTVGKYEDLRKVNTAGSNNLTAHHMPSDGYMQELLSKGLISGYTKDDGLTMLVHSIFGDKTARHQRTKTYFKNKTQIPDYFSLSPKEALKHDIDELRELFITDGVYNAQIEKALQDFITKTKNKYPNLF